MRRLAVAMPERRCLRDRAPWAMEARRMVPGRSLKAAESATLIQVSHPRRLPSESIRKRIDRLVLGHPDWTACCEDRRVRWASCKREVRDRGASPPSRALRGLEPTRILSAADGGTPLTRYVQARVSKCDMRPSSERRHGSCVLEPAFRGRFLRSHGYHFAQGFFFRPPVEPDEIEELVGGDPLPSTRDGKALTGS